MEVKYIHTDRHPTCCCAQCISDEGEHEIATLTAKIAELSRLLSRYRKEVPSGYHPHMICLEVDKALESDGNE